MLSLIHILPSFTIAEAYVLFNSVSPFDNALLNWLEKDPSDCRLAARSAVVSVSVLEPESAAEDTASRVSSASLISFSEEPDVSSKFFRTFWYSFRLSLVSESAVESSELLLSIFPVRSPAEVRISSDTVSAATEENVSLICCWIVEAPAVSYTHLGIWHQYEQL